MNLSTITFLVAGGLFLGMLLLQELGRRAGARRLVLDPEGARHGLGVVEGAVFSLLGLLLAFTFSGAASRFDGRRLLIIDEANDIGTAYLRIDLLPESAHPVMRELFRKYLDSRLKMYRLLPDMEAARVEFAHTLELQGQIWSAAVKAAQETGTPPAQILLLPALNSMFDIATARREAMKVHPPPIIFVMVCALSLAASLFAGYGMAGGKSRSWMHGVGFAMVLSVTVYVIVDLEYPRLGLIRVEEADIVLYELRESME